MKVQQVQNSSQQFGSVNVQVSPFLSSSLPNAFQAAKVLEKECGDYNLKIRSQMEAYMRSGIVGLTPINDPKFFEQLTDTIIVSAKKSTKTLGEKLEAIFTQPEEVIAKSSKTEDIIVAGKEALDKLG